MDNMDKNVIQLFQYNTLAALMAGMYSGNFTIGELLEHGDMGIGTLDAIDGELIIIDGKAYQARSTTKGKLEVLEVDEKETVPYAAVAFHKTEVSFYQRFAVTADDLKARIEQYFDGENLFRSFIITGTFAKMHVRTIPKSSEEERFAKVAKNQPEFTKENVKGRIVGFWTPELFHGVSVMGYHLHFLSDDAKFGGHVLDFEIIEGQIEIGPIDEMNQRFPAHNTKYLFAQMDVEQLRQDITESE